MDLIRRVKVYFLSSSIQGLKYIAEPGRHWTERLFWTLACLFAAYGMTVLTGKSYSNTVENPVSFVVDKDWLEWNTTFPCISVCETDADCGAIAIPANRLFGVDHDLDFETFLKNIVYYDGECYACDELCGVTINCTEDIQYLINQVIQPCHQLLTDCSWMGEPFDCCGEFRPLLTETGKCYTINSIQVDQSKVKKKEYTVNKKTGPGFLEFKTTKDINVFLHNAEDLPFLNTPQGEKKIIFTGTKLEMSFLMTEIENDPMLDKIPIEKRKCRFPKENPLGSQRYYSYSACVVECRAQAMVQYCNCTHHYISPINGSKICDLQGLSCLSKHKMEIGSLRTPDSNKPGLVCPCYPSCTETDYQVVEEVASSSGNNSYSIVKISMKSLPETRFRRYIVRTALDLVVSVGGTAGLFLGASLLSIAEMVYFALMRRHGTTSSCWQLYRLLARKKRRKTNNPPVYNAQVLKRTKNGLTYRRYIPYRPYLP